MSCHYDDYSDVVYSESFSWLTPEQQDQERKKGQTYAQQVIIDRIAQKQQTNNCPGYMDCYGDYTESYSDNSDYEFLEEPLQPKENVSYPVKKPNIFQRIFGHRSK